jgi:type I restriction enzyme S subunit
MKFEKLKNIVEVKKGKKPSFVETPDENSVRVLQIDDLRNDTNQKFTNDKTGVLAKEDDVLIAWDGANAGTIGYGKSGYIGSTIALLRKKQPDLYSTTFIGIFLQSQYQYLRSKTTGATIPHISRKALDELEVPVISVNTQLHIASILSKAENLIAQRKESIRLLDEFLKSTFLEMFGDPVINSKQWRIIKIKDCGKIVTGTTPPSSKDAMFGGEIPFITPSDLESDEPNKRFVTELGAANSRTVRKGATFICCIGATIGKVQRAKVLSAFNQQLNAIEWNNDFNDLFGERLMRFMKPRIITKGGGSTTLPILNKGDFEKIEIIHPPLALQTQFAHIVEKTEALKTQYQQSLQELENLYGSLSQKAFKGELTAKQNSTNP